MTADDTLPVAVTDMIGRPRYCVEADVEVNRVNIRAMCAAVENGNPIYWDRAVAEEIAGAEIAPACMLPAWGRPELWAPDRETQVKALQTHYDLKEMLGYPVAIAGNFESVFYDPVKVGDRLRTQQVLTSVSDVKQTRLGRGRFWTIEMQYHTADGQLAGVDSFNFFGYHKEQA